MVCRDTSPAIRKTIILFELFSSIHDDENDRRFASKSKIIDELVQTEMDYFKVMKTLYDVYMGPNSDKTVNGVQNSISARVVIEIKFVF